jgi:hypothetical protein
MKSRHPKNKITIVGGGIIAALEVYFTYLNVKKSGEQVRVTIYERNKTLAGVLK